MENQGKQLLLAVALAMVVLFAFQIIWPSEEKKKETPTETTPTTTGTTVAAGPVNPVGMTPDGKTAPDPSLGPEQTIELSYPQVTARFSSHGGVLESWHLTDRRYDRDKSKGELIPQEVDAGAFAVNFANSTYVLPQHGEWKGEKLSDRTVKYTTSTDALTVEKLFELVPEAYVVKLTVKVTAKVPAGKEARQILAVSTFGFQDPKDDHDGGESIAARVWMSSTLRGEEVFNTSVKAVMKKPRYEYKLTWTGFEHPYLFVALAPKPQPDQEAQKQTVAVGDKGLMRTDLIVKPESVFKSDSGAVERSFVAYLGPKHYSQLNAADTIAGFPTGFDTTIDLGWFAFIGKPLMWLLLKFYSFVGNWGIAIMLLTLLVKGATIPFTTKSMRSMKAMAVLAPEMKALQERYKDDRQRLQMETMALYKQHGANPLSGCLPILLQMPIWLALYRMLSSTGELYLQPFIPGWINDLTDSDPYHVLPILLLVTMIGQARLQPMSPDPSQKLQQNMMKWGLPIMFGVMAFFFPAGLTIYIFTNTILSALHSVWMNKFDKKSIAIAEKIKAAQEKAAQDREKAKAKPVIDAKSEDKGEDGAPRANPNPNRPRHQQRKKRKR
jgi:YidC/Oxa1 family membrane protein insertase